MKNKGYGMTHDSFGKVSVTQAWWLPEFGSWTACKKMDVTMSSCIPALCFGGTAETKG